MSGAVILRRILAVLIFGGALLLVAHLIGDLNRVKGLKGDLGEINNVRYGLLDADQWVGRVSTIVERRVNEFELTEQNRPQIKRAVEQVLDTLIVEVEQYLRRRNLQGGGSWMDQIKGVLQQGLQDLLVDFDELRRKVPQYAELVLEELSKPEAKRELKTQLLGFLQQASDSTFAKTDRTQLESLLAHHGCPDVQTCSFELRAAIAQARGPILYQFAGLLALIGLLFLVCLTGTPDFDQTKLLLLTGATLTLLAGGVTTPMIEIEARISELGFQLLGEPVTFTDQVLYFQSKSVFDVVQILVETGAMDMLLVAFLITLFSLVFPALKVVATYLYYYDFRGMRHSPPVHFFALKSGKWSMADVLVIAIFMAYIGFSGLISSQLGNLSRPGGAVEVLTTNGTSLEPGFFLFLAFVLASLLLSTVLENRIGEGHAT